jgi:thioredoxin-like negative regulator of GroEL
MLFLASLLLCAPTLAPAPSAETPFVEMSFDAALAEAKRTDKMVMIDFFTTWCGPCKRLDRTTWKDPKVVEWLGQRCIALKVDCDRNGDLKQRFRIVAYPTMVFVNGEGKELDRLRGFRDAAQFLSEVRDLMSGKDSLARAKDSLAGHEKDPMVRGSYARELAQLGKYDQALAEYMWCWDEGAKAQPAYSGVRRSFLLSDIAELGKLHAPVQDALRSRRDAAEGRLKAGSDSRDDAADVCALNRTLAENDRTVALYDELRKKGPVSAALRTTFAREVLELFAKERRYADVVDMLEDPVRYIEQQIGFARQIEDLGKGTLDETAAATAKAAQRAATVGRMIPVFEALVGVKRAEDGKRAADLLLEFANTDVTYTALVDAAARAGDAAFARELAQRNGKVPGAK